MSKSTVAGSLYKLRGKVLKVYDPREVILNYGGKRVVKEVSDMSLQLPTGAKVKVSFWDTDVSHHEGSTVDISKLQFKGRYPATSNGVPQYSGTKGTTISVVGKAAARPAAEPASPEGAELEGEPVLKDPEVPEGAEAEAEPEDQEVPCEAGEPEAEPEPAPAPVKRTVRKVAAPDTPEKKRAAHAYVVDANALATLTAIGAEAIRIAGYTAPASIKEDPKAFQGWASTIFINLCTKDYYAHGGK